MSQLQVPHLKIRRLQSHDLQEMQTLILLDLHETLQQTSLSLLQLLWLPRHALLRPRWSLPRKSQTVRPLLTPTLSHNRSADDLPICAACLHDRLTLRQPLHLVQLKTRTMGVSISQLALLQLRLHWNQIHRLAVPPTSSYPLCCFCCPHQNNSPNVLLVLHYFWMIQSSMTIIRLQICKIKRLSWSLCYRNPSEISNDR